MRKRFQNEGHPARSVGRSLLRGSLVAAGATALAFFAIARSETREEQAASPARAVFEVASIKPNLSGSSGRHEHFTNGRLVAVNITVKSVITDAYGMADYQISGEPGWVDSDAYDIDAKMDDEAAAAWQKLPNEERAAQRKLALQALLAERFGLKVTHETKELPVYALVVAKSGIKFSPTKLPPEQAGAANPPADPKEPRRGVDVEGHGLEYSATGTGVKMSSWAKVLADQPEVGRRVVVDKTELAGEYDLAMKWTQEKSDSGATPAAMDGSGPSLFTALGQLGLKLEATKGPVDTIVIVHIEKPSEN